MYARSWSENAPSRDGRAIRRRAREPSLTTMSAPMMCKDPKTPARSTTITPSAGSSRNGPMGGTSLPRACGDSEASARGPLAEMIHAGLIEVAGRSISDAQLALS